MTGSRNESEGITTNYIEMKRIVRIEYYEQLHANKLDNLNEMDKIREKQYIPTSPCHPHRPPPWAPGTTLAPQLVSG